MGLNATLTVLRAAWRRPAWIELLAVGGGLLGVTLGLLRGSQPGTVKAMNLAALAVVLLGMYVVQGLVRQNHPYLARLMPAQRRSLQRALGLTLLLCLAACAGLWWALAPTQRPVMLLVANLLLWLTGCVGLSRAWASLAVPGLAAAWLVAAAWGGWPKTEALWAVIALTGLALVLGLPALLRQGDAAHVAHWRRQRSTEALLAISLEGGKLGALQSTGWLARVLRWWLWPTRRLVASAAQPVAGGADALRRALWVLNPSLHIAQQAWMLLTIGLPVSLGTLAPLLWRHGGDAPAEGWLAGMAVGTVLWMLLLNLGSSVTEHWSTRGEQALMRLVPGMPQGAALRQGWARTLQRQAWAGLALHGVVAVAAGVWVAPEAWPHALAAVGLVAPAAWLLPQRRWAHQAPPQGHWMGLATGWALLSAAVVAVPLLGGPALWPLTLGAWLLAGAQAWRLHRLPHPTPWPVGHAGD